MTRTLSNPGIFLTGLAIMGFGLGSLSTRPAFAQTNPVAGIEPVYSSTESMESIPEISAPVDAQLAPVAEPQAQRASQAPASLSVAVESAPTDSPQELLQPNAQGADSLEGTDNLEVSQAVISPGRSTRSGPSYLGIAGNIGLGGDTTLGDSGFAVISKIGLTRNISARPGVVIGDNDPAILLPVTIDFPISSVLETGELNLEAAPFVGGGIAISTGSDSLVRPLISAGIDVPVASRITATAAVNFAFFDDTEVGLILGAGYSF
jgi:hypothetical protein